MFAIIYLMASRGQRNDIATLPVYAYDKAFTGIRQYAISSTYRGADPVDPAGVRGLLQTRTRQARGGVVSHGI